VHLTHKASGTVLGWALKGAKTAAVMAKQLGKLPINFTVPHPGTLYRQLAKLDDKRLTRFREIMGKPTGIDLVKWRKDLREMAHVFDTSVALKGYGRKAARQGRRSKRGK
jgi:hypothetical protein